MYFWGTKAPFATTLFKRGDGLIFKGGPILRLQYIDSIWMVMYTSVTQMVVKFYTYSDIALQT